MGSQFPGIIKVNVIHILSKTVITGFLARFARDIQDLRCGPSRAHASKGSWTAWRRAGGVFTTEGGGDPRSKQLRRFPYQGDSSTMQCVPPMYKTIQPPALTF